MYKSKLATIPIVTGLVNLGQSTNTVAVVVRRTMKRHTSVFGWVSRARERAQDMKVLLRFFTEPLEVYMV